MNRLLLPFALLAAATSAGDDAPYHLTMPKGDVRIALAYYQHLTGKPTYLSLDVVKATTMVFSGNPISEADAVKLIERTLLERNGIRLRETPAGEVLAEWSDDPAFPKSDEPRAMPGDDKNASRIRIQVPPGGK